MRMTPGSRLGPYEVVSHLGSGGMGDVWRARDTRLGRDVALKVLSPALASPENVARLQREARAVAALSHPNIVAVYDAGSAGELAWVVMELLEGETLRERMAGGALAPRKVAEIGAQVARGLAAAHERGFVHRDLKPENVFLTRDGVTKILDFGLAKEHPLAGDGGATIPNHTEPGLVVGTAGYMSPEQVRGAPVDPRSDVFSLGAVLFEMATGRRAFRAETNAETMAAVLREDPFDRPSGAPALPLGLERVLRHCLEKVPEDRFQSARDLGFALEALTGASMSGAPGFPARRPRASWRALAPALGAAAGLALLAGAWLAGRASARVPAPSFQRITFRHGNVLSARFAPDGRNVVYTASWEGSPIELFTARVDGTASRPLGVANAEVLAVSQTGDVAVQLQTVYSGAPQGLGTLAVTTLDGGRPRELLEGAGRAAYGPDGRLAVIRGAAGKMRVEYPPGSVLYETGRPLTRIDVSPDGERVAFGEVAPEGSHLTIRTVRRDGSVRLLARDWSRSTRLRFDPRSGDLLVLGSKGGSAPRLVALDAQGRERFLAPFGVGSDVILHDVAADGRLLIEESHLEVRVASIGPGAAERNLTWLDGSKVADVSADGALLLFNEDGLGGGPDGSVYLRRLADALPVRLGPGRAFQLASDGRSVLASRPGAPLVALPTGAGAERAFDTRGLERLLDAAFLPAGRAVALAGVKGGPARLYRLAADAPPAPFSPATGFPPFHLVPSPDGASVVAADLDGRPTRYALDGGAPSPLAGLPGGPLTPVRWSADGNEILLAATEDVPSRLYRYDLRAATCTLARELTGVDPIGVSTLVAVRATPDFRTVVTSYFRVLNSDLYVVTPIP